MSGIPTSAPPSLLPDLPCACANLRRAARLVTQLYSEEMGRELEPGPFATLSFLSMRPGASQSAAGSALGLDKTTMSRNLLLLRSRNWIEWVPTDDRRERGYRLTETGAEILAAAKPGWLRAQEKMRAALGAEQWDAMFQLVGHVADSAVRARRDS